MKVGDKVKVVKDESSTDLYKQYLGTEQIIEAIDYYNKYVFLKGINETYEDGARLFFETNELELVEVESSLEHYESYYAEVNNEKISFNDNNGFKNIMIGNKAYSMENAKKLVNVLNEMLDKCDKMEYTK